MKFQFIFDHRETFKVGRVCKLLNVSRSGYHAWRTRPESRQSGENRSLAAKIRVLHAASHGIYGAPRIHRIICSMSRKGNCYDNAVVESFFARLKSEWINHNRYRSRSEAIRSLFYYLEIFYNRKRRHSSIDYITPQKYEILPLAA